MLPRTRTLLLAAGISGAMALLSSVAHAITITRAEVQWGDAVVMGRGAAANETINWEGFDVTTANKRGKFSFVSDVVPLDCEGTLSVTEGTINIELDNCTRDSEEPEPEPIPELPLYREQKDAHNGDAVRAVGFVDDGAGGTWVTSGGEDAYLLSWSWPPDIPNLNLEHFEELDHIIYDLETSADGSIVATGEGGWNGGPGSDTLRIWNNSAFLVGTTAPIGFVYCVAISPGNQWTVASGFYGDIVVYRTSSLELYATKKTKKKRTKSWSFPIDFYPKPDATKIVSGSDGGMIKVWTIENLTAAPSVVSVLVVDSGAVYSLAWSPDGSMIVAGGNGDITVYDADTLKILYQTVNAHTSRVNDVAFSPDGSMIASGGANGALKLWDLGAP